MFRAYLGPSSGGTTICIQQLVLIILLDDWLLSWLAYFVKLYMFRPIIRRYNHMYTTGGTYSFGWLTAVLIGIFRQTLHVSAHHQEVQPYVYNRWYLLFFWMTDCCPDWHISSNSTCFGPSSGGTTICIQQVVLIILFRWLSVVLIGLELMHPRQQTVIQKE